MDKTDIIDGFLKEMEEDKRSDDIRIALLGRIFAKDCIWHVIIPTIFSGIYDKCNIIIERSRKNTPVFCVKCNVPCYGKIVQLGLRVLLSKGELLDNHWNYIFGFDWTLICETCCGEKKTLVLTTFPQLQLIENWLDGVAGDHTNESLEHNLSAFELWTQVRKLFDAQYHQMIKEFGIVYGMCEKCQKASPKKRCGGCHVARYCNEKCSNAHWPMHKSECHSFRSRHSVFEKEENYIIISQ